MVATEDSCSGSLPLRVSRLSTTLKEIEELQTGRRQESDVIGAEEGVSPHWGREKM